MHLLQSSSKCIFFVLKKFKVLPRHFDMLVSVTIEEICFAISYKLIMEVLMMINYSKST